MYLGETLQKEMMIMKDGRKKKVKSTVAIRDDQSDHFGDRTKLFWALLGKNWNSFKSQKNSHGIGLMLNKFFI